MVDCCLHLYLTPQDGRTALYTASFNGHEKVVELLTNAGAVVDIQNEVVVCGFVYFVGV